MRLICKDKSILACELTLSIRSRTLNDEDTSLGIVDLNPKKSAKFLDKSQATEKELLLCLRPILIGEQKMGGYTQMAQHVSESSNANDSGESTQNKISSTSEKLSSGSDEKEGSGSDDFGEDTPSSETHQANKKPCPPKKRKFDSEESGLTSNNESPTKMQCIQGNDSQNKEEQCHQGKTD